jgi:hypothetical protein
MPLPQTYEEFIAKKINPRNYSDILSTIYDLRKRQNDEYIPPAFDRIVYASLAIGENSASAIFNSLSNSSFAKGAAITLSGTATYKLVNGGTVLALKPAIKITAQIDIGRSGPPDSLPAYQVECKASEIDSDGVFSFVIPSEITSKLVAGRHTVYIDAHSPNNPPVRLTASGATNNQREFTILG